MAEQKQARVHLHGAQRVTPSQYDQCLTCAGIMHLPNYDVFGHEAADCNYEVVFTLYSRLDQ
jgi:hypothetical protein